MMTFIFSFSSTVCSKLTSQGRVPFSEANRPHNSFTEEVALVTNYQRMTFKLGLLTFKVLAHKEPTYLCQLLLPYNPTRQLRSSDQHLLTVPNIKSYMGRSSFSFSAPSIWNSLPLPLRSCESVSSFRKLLKRISFLHA